MAGALGLERYAVLGHSYGAFIALQHAVDFPGRPAATIVSSGIPDARFLAHVEEELAAFEPVELREQVQRVVGRARPMRARRRTSRRCSPTSSRSTSPTRATRASTNCAPPWATRSTGPTCCARPRPEDYGAIAVEDRLADVAHPVLVLAGRHDRTCSVRGGRGDARAACPTPSSWSSSTAAT